jgi:hypothetical protein
MRAQNANLLDGLSESQQRVLRRMALDRGLSLEELVRELLLKRAAEFFRSREGGKEGGSDEG